MRSNTLCFLVSLGLPGGPLLAQAAFLHPLADSAAAVEYHGYTAGECLAAVQRVGGMARRTDAVAPDTTVWERTFLESDTVLHVQRQTAATCLAAAPLTLTTTPVSDLPDLARLYWFVGDTASLHQAVQRRLSADHSDSARAVTYRQLLVRFLFHRQRDLAFTRRIVRPGLDTLASVAAQMVRFQVHVALAYTFAASRRAVVGDSLQVEIDSALQSFTALPPVWQMTEVDTVGHLIALGVAETSERGDTARAHHLLAVARQALPKLPGGADYVHQAEAMIRYFGMKAPPIHADFVYGAGPTATPAGPWPRLGRWTLFAPLPYGSELAGFYQHLHATVGDSVDIVFTAATQGYWRPHGPLTPADEAALMYDYVAHRYEIPAALLVETRPWHRLPDGRRINDPVITPGIYASGLVVDPHGTIRAIMQPSTLVRFDLLLRELMRRTSADGMPTP